MIRDAKTPEPLELDRIVEAYLQISMQHPEKQPKTQRAQRENQMMILGFNQAQEALRTLLANHGYSEATRALAEVRAEGQQQPMDVGGLKAWVA